MLKKKESQELDAEWTVAKKAQKSRLIGAEHPLVTRHVSYAAAAHRISAVT